MKDKRSEVGRGKLRENQLVWNEVVDEIAAVIRDTLSARRTSLCSTTVSFIVTVERI